MLTRLRFLRETFIYSSEFFLDAECFYIDKSPSGLDGPFLNLQTALYPLRLFQNV